jgi:RNA recognition motif-containing protein
MQLYVGNLDYGTTEETLATLFATIGEVVSTKLIMDPTTGRSKGFGFIEMASKNDGIKAISKLNGAEVNGRNIKVNEGQKKPAFSGNQNRRW